ncbi:MAG: Branched-chain amino acid transport system ATP-binding protein [Caballeronia sp.]|jgi:branched-chain amino acid transport system ATP-binding protein|uniref:ABC transporter ATP-binding protein n=1 Tax=Caballeronia sp. TaxID=1931223 RepID=UPI0026327243|nr:ABC transporter ATP-binding protein [Caballeronia sp.]MDB5837367.1 Branched-chain amino acid transport system ATP-binding protein [Caballeronia sp.]
MLKIEGLRAGYKGTEALHGISLEIRQGTIVAAVGANGAGKSTLINTLSRLVDVNAGAITFDGQDIVRLSAPEVVELGIVQVPEGRQLFSALTVTENLRLGFHRLRRHRASALFRERLDYVYDLFPKLKERADQRAVTLSGGEQSMVAIGRALMADPKLLLLDEPSLGLAPIVVERMFNVLQVLRRSGLTILLVEQHADEALALSDYGYVLSVGNIAAEGTGESLRNHESIQQAYLG